MTLEEAKIVFSIYLKNNNSPLSVNDYEPQIYNNDSIIFSRQASERPNPTYMVRNNKVASINFASTTIEEVYSQLS